MAGRSSSRAARTPRRASLELEGAV
jgi:hypothetical protein